MSRVAVGLPGLETEWVKCLKVCMRSEKGAYDELKGRDSFSISNSYSSPGLNYGNHYSAGSTGGYGYRSYSNVNSGYSYATSPQSARGYYARPYSAPASATYVQPQENSVAQEGSYRTVPSSLYTDRQEVPPSPSYSNSVLEQTPTSQGYALPPGSPVRTRKL
ncbi:unnamed protein product [Heligmosomoides polygyrus]|uniref:Eyes absent homolog n=1 Tax=Heligmosomoides polygyrus TaxID=6339 RepID=A0A183GKS7_HELPZ|nr:unnamed protein product [Heligmosomoides polygyrus]